MMKHVTQYSLELSQPDKVRVGTDARRALAKAEAAVIVRQRRDAGTRT